MRRARPDGPASVLPLQYRRTGEVDQGRDQRGAAVRFRFAGGGCQDDGPTSALCTTEPGASLHMAGRRLR